MRVLWGVVGGLVFDVFGIGGLFNNAREFFGMETLLVMQKESWFRPIYVFSTIWKESGWGTVVYLSAIRSIDPSLYESAAIDGASRFKKIRYITFQLRNTDVNFHFSLQNSHQGNKYLVLYLSSLLGVF